MTANCAARLLRPRVPFPRPLRRASLRSAPQDEGRERPIALRRPSLRFSPLVSGARAGEKPAMLHINELTYRLGERLLIDHASVALPTGAHVGLVGRNGAGKTTLFRLICGELSPEGGSIVAAPARPDRARRAGGAGRPAGADRLRARGRRRARAPCSKRPRPPTIRCASPKSRPASSTSTPMPRRRAPRAFSPASASTRRRRTASARRVFRRLAHARRARGRAVLRRPTCCCSTSRPIISISKARSGSSTI